MKFAAILVCGTLCFAAAPAFAQSSGDSENAPNVVQNFPSYVLVSANAFSGPRERNRIWRLFNNNCIRRHDETNLEVNMCVAMHRDSPMPARRNALTYLERVGMLDFHGFTLTFMANGLATSTPDRVLYVTRRIATSSPLGQFLLELCRDEARMLRFLNRQQIQLE